MHVKFRLFIQKHPIGTYTVTVPGVRRVSPLSTEDVLPAAASLSAYGLLLEEARDDVREALEKWLAKADPAELGRLTNYREGQFLETVEVELRPEDRHGQKRKDRVRHKFSLMLEKLESQQYLVTVPRLLDPPLQFYCFSLDELRETASRELATYFSKASLEELLEYEYQRQEFLDELEVSFNPLKPQRERKKGKDEEEREFWALKASGMNLTARSREGRLARPFRREREVTEVLNTLAAERGASVLLVGPSGVGKTAIMHEVVRRIREEQCPESLRKRQVWSTTANQLIAGCMFVGSWQEKLQNVVDEVKRRRHLLHMEDVTELLDAGRSSSGDDNMAQFLRPLLADGTVVLVGETTAERLRVAETRDPGFLSTFRIIQVEETSDDTTLSILTAVAAGLEQRLKVRIEPGASQVGAELTRRFQPYRACPGKAVQFLERAAADAAGAAGEERPVITRQQAVRAFARYSGLPEFLLSDHLTLDTEGLRRHFSERLIGQPEAVETVTDLVTVVKAGLNDPNKPLGCYFFVGPTGVGKTEMVKALAEYLFGSADRVLRFDMSEYSLPHTVATLIGGGAGGAEGELTKRIRLQPFSVVLLDEFEKADPAIYDLMLQVLGEGRLTDAAGHTADFRSAIVIMTSNLGATARDQRQPGIRLGGEQASSARHYVDQVERYFRPEFVNRLDRIVAFRPLSEEAMRRIAARELEKLLHREGIRRRNLLLEIDDSVVELLLETGFSPVYGARPLKREIERRVIVPLSRYLVAHRLGESQLIHLRAEEGQLRLASSSLGTPRETIRQVGALSGETDGSASLDPARLIEALAAVRLRLYQWAEGDTLREIRNEWQRLLAETRRRSFPTHGPEAHRVWSRIYHLERLSHRVEQLRDRADYLEEFAQLSHRERYRDYHGELARSYEGLTRDTDYLEIELLCAHLTESGQALLQLSAVGRAVQAAGSDRWVLQLARTYLAWTRRKGYSTEVFVPLESYYRWVQERGLELKRHLPTFDPGPPARPFWAELGVKEAKAQAERLAEIDPPRLILAVKGPNVFGFLKGEAGTHKLVLRPEDSEGAAPVQTAVVSVESLDEETAAGAHLEAEAEKAVHEAAGQRATPPEVPEVIRIYSPEGDRFVRDVRTGVRTNRVRDVFEGDLDELILAYLKTAEAEQAWD